MSRNCEKFVKSQSMMRKIAFLKREVDKEKQTKGSAFLYAYFLE